MGQLRSQILKQKIRNDGQRLQNGTTFGAIKHSLGQWCQRIYSFHDCSANRKCIGSYSYLRITQLVMPLSHRCNEQTNLLELQIPTKRRSVCTKDFNKLFVEVDEQWLNPPFKQFAR